MSGKRQKNQLRLAFGEEGRSEAPMAPGEGAETLTAKRRIESPGYWVPTDRSSSVGWKYHEQLMEEVCERENCLQAYKPVKSNKGSPGIDGMTVDDLTAYLNVSVRATASVLRGESVMNFLYERSGSGEYQASSPERRGSRA
ncbi:MAG: hypothetical protein ABR907_01190, partial [Terracidiphilus sp.]